MSVNSWLSGPLADVDGGNSSLCDDDVGPGKDKALWW